ncbi:MAG: long-chain fatty acid--CoA ligase [bacterium]|nr:long-chain fatty acid--CoA ligase [bacterium]
MKGLMMDFQLTLPHLLQRARRYFEKVEIVSRMPDKSCHRYTYGDFYTRANKLANALTRAGVKRGERVATLMWNHYAHLEAYFGIPCAGFVIHTLNLRLHPSDIADLINHAEDRVLIVDDVLLPLYKQIKDRVNPKQILVVPLTGQPVPEGMVNYEDFIRDEPEEFDYPDLNEYEAAGLCYTSGTTGKPKGAVYSHRALTLHSFAFSLAPAVGMGHNDTVCPTVSMYHVNAWGLPYMAVMLGAKQVLTGPHLDPVSLLELFSTEHVTLSAGVPTIWIGVLHEIQQNPERWDLASLRTILVGGAAAPETLIREFDRYGITIMHAWGMTETTPAVLTSRLKNYMTGLSEAEQYRYRSKTGYPIPFTEVRVMSMDGSAEVPPDGQTMGELQTRGPWIASSYFNRPDLAATWTADGWFRTGDVATIDSEGYVQITDRTRDLVKSGGEWISSLALENAMMAHPAVKEAAVVAIPHPKWGERPLAAIVLQEGRHATAEEIRRFLASRFLKWWLPEVLLFLDEIPKTSTGKFLKKALRARYKDWKWED